MGKEQKINELKEKLFKDLLELLRIGKEREILESEINKDRDRDAQNIRKGMLRIITDNYFAQVLKIAKEEEEIDKLNTQK